MQVIYGQCNPKLGFIFVLSIFLFFGSDLKSLALSADSDIETNRPSFSDSPLVVPKGSLQLENGLLYSHAQHGVNYFEIPENEVRVGITSKTEFQMFTPDWAILHTIGPSSNAIANSKPSSNVIQSSSGGTQSGASNINEIGIKRQLFPLGERLNIAFIGGVNVPTGRRLFSGTGVQPVLRMPWNKPFYCNWTIGGMQSLLVINSGRDVQWQNFWLVSRSFGLRTSTFIEYAGFYTHQAAPNNIIHFGIVRKLSRHNQIDLHFGFGLNKNAPAAFIGTGYSFRFDHLPLLD